MAKNSKALIRSWEPYIKKYSRRSDFLSRSIPSLCGLLMGVAGSRSQTQVFHQPGRRNSALRHHRDGLYRHRQTLGGCIPATTLAGRFRLPFSIAGSCASGDCSTAFCASCGVVVSSPHGRVPLLSDASRRSSGDAKPLLLFLIAAVVVWTPARDSGRSRERSVRRPSWRRRDPTCRQVCPAAVARHRPSAEPSGVERAGLQQHVPRLMVSLILV